MNQQRRIAATPRKGTKLAGGRSRPVPKFGKLAQTVTLAGAAIGRTGMRAARPLARSLRREEAGTLAKMAVAALAPKMAPKMANALIRFAIRNPLVAVTVMIAFAAVATMSDDAEASA